VIVKFAILTSSDYCFPKRQMSLSPTYLPQIPTSEICLATSSVLPMETESDPPDGKGLSWRDEVIHNTVIIFKSDYPRPVVTDLDDYLADN